MIPTIAACRSDAGERAGNSENHRAFRRLPNRRIGQLKYHCGDATDERGHRIPEDVPTDGVGRQERCLAKLERRAGSLPGRSDIGPRVARSIPASSFTLHRPIVLRGKRRSGARHQSAAM
jgi:hypothetical protein